MSCSGHCCKAFFVCLNPTEMAQRLEDERSGKQPTKMQDLAQIAAMVIHLGSFTNAEAAERFGIDVNGVRDDGKPGDYYTCKNLVDDRCSVYATRPRMCSGYPYGKPCQYTACTAENRGKDFVDERRLKRHVATHIEIDDSPEPDGKEMSALCSST